MAAAVEDDAAAAHRNVLSQADGDGIRHLGVTGLGGAAVVTMYRKADLA